MIDAKKSLVRHQLAYLGALLALVTALGLPVNAWTQANEVQATQNPAAVVGQNETAATAQARVDQIFADAQEMDVAGQRCLPARRIRSVDVLDSRTLVFDMGRDENYLVRLQRECFGLRRDTPISYELHGSQFCKHDGFRALERWGINQFVPGPRCFVPAFIPVNDEERELAKARVKADRKAKISARKAEKAARREAKKAAKAAAKRQRQDAGEQLADNA